MTTISKIIIDRKGGPPSPPPSPQPAPVPAAESRGPVVNREAPPVPAAAAPLLVAETLVERLYPAATRASTAALAPGPAAPAPEVI